MSRVIDARYLDPADAIWLSAACRIGFRIERSEDAYATTNGRGVISIGVRATLDADDCLAQMILHEICHSLVEGRESFSRRDWGLDNVSSRDEEREHACLRLQAALLRQYGLREVLAPTTDYRGFYDQLPEDPLCGESSDAIAARIGFARVDEAPWTPHVRDALMATSKIAEVVAPLDDSAGSLWRRYTMRASTTFK